MSFGYLLGKHSRGCRSDGERRASALHELSTQTVLLDLARPRLAALAAKPEPWWMDEVPFFDVRRERIWVFWRRVLHTAHHRAHLGVYLRLLDRPVPAVYGPTADVTWQGADPTQTVDAARRK